ncbi:hypothetical protein EBZ80_05385 [bacterium]|nr:hypothetical protein [bacterium]
MDPDGVWYRARVRSVDADGVRVSYCGWSSRWDSCLAHGSPAMAPCGSFSDAAFYEKTLERGEVIEACIEGKWYTSEVVAVDGALTIRPSHGRAAVVIGDREKQTASPGTHTPQPDRYRSGHHILATLALWPMDSSRDAPHLYFRPGHGLSWSPHHREYV